MCLRLAPNSKPPEENEEAQSEGKEETVLGIEIGWIFPALRRLRGGGRGESVSHWPVSLLRVNLMVPSLVQRPRQSLASRNLRRAKVPVNPEGAGQSRRRFPSLGASNTDLIASVRRLDPPGVSEVDAGGQRGRTRPA